jgi:hypothetical protein
VVDHPAGVAGEHLEEVPLGGRELDVHAVPRHPPGTRVDREVVGADHRPRRFGGAATDRGAQPGEELVHAERLDHVVVGAGVEGCDLLPGRLAGRQHEDRNAGPAAQPGDDLGTVHVREAEVQDDGVRRMARRQCQRARPGRRRVHLVAAGLQVDRQRCAVLTRS